MGILTWIIFGLLAGVVAKFLMPGKDPSGWIITILLGIGGSILGGMIAAQFGMGGVAKFNLGSFVIAVGGAMLLLLIYRVVQKR